MSLIETIRTNTDTVIGDTELEDRMHGNRPLRVKLGVDPTRPDLTFGHLVVFNKLRQFQDIGHEAVLIIGDFTTLIGDPSGRSNTRPVLTKDEIIEHVWDGRIVSDGTLNSRINSARRAVGDDGKGICFLSASPDSEHHELVLMGGRHSDSATRVVQQIAGILHRLVGLGRRIFRCKAEAKHLGTVQFTSGLASQVDFIAGVDNHAGFAVDTGLTEPIAGV